MPRNSTEQRCHSQQDVSESFNTAAPQVPRFPSTGLAAWYQEDEARLLQGWLPAVLLYVHILIFSVFDLSDLLVSIYTLQFHCLHVCICMHYN